ncbi:FAD-dependent monooxygenase [Candidatus Methylospira mobilis]|uniref:FAD-dependent oxidoreductase n=1 Tax=Candidatus Methylospira mobilis TaxID=1808979 RepID=UPI0028F00825|nr:FAD-dependent monooxygenase [Candidatus Methylospira mobilis]WNV05658.1 FAD-dependent monooxygenase [Candidatus Methylospira mobilis]
MQETTANRERVDVLIAGGSIAGVAAAAALAQLGLRVLIVEPSPDQGRRLAGELVHPPGIDGLRELGLLAEHDGLGQKVQGFAVFSQGGEAGPQPMVLPYGEVDGKRPVGLAIEHTTLKERLLERVKTFNAVDVWQGARVTAMNSVEGGSYVATVDTGSAESELRVHARLILGADGPMSQMRKMIGIQYETQRYSGMMGTEVSDAHLPYHGYGNIFLNQVGVSYAYAIGGGRVRVMFEILKGADQKGSIAAHLAAFPDEFRREVQVAMMASKPLAAANYCIIPETTVKGNVALIGDARGCCHPLTASGITAAVKDAFVLRDALRKHNLDVTAALREYAQVCDQLQLTRRTLAEELREAFLAETPQAKLLKQCIFSYWKTSPQGRAESMNLLSTLNSSIIALAVQYAMVALQAFRLLPQWIKSNALMDWVRGVIGLLFKSLSFQYVAITQRVK